MNTILKISLLILYIAGLIGGLGLIEHSWLDTARNISLIILAIHVIETLVVLKYLKKASGSLFTHFLLSLLFGLLHWRPLVQQQTQ